MKSLMPNIAYGKTLSILIIVCLLGCDFGDTNIDPTALSDVNINLILPAAQAQTARNIGSIGGRITGTVIQQFKGIDAQPETYNTYLIDENALDTYWRTGLYAAAMRDCHLIIEKSKEQNSPHYSAIAKILMAYNLGIVTTFWGDVPYSEAFSLENLKTPYDSQKDVYSSIQQLLDESIEQLSLPAGDILPGDDDLIFNGNRMLWIRTARALKARYLLHLSKRDIDTAEKIITLLEQDRLTENSMEPEFPFGETQNEANPIAFFGEDRPDQLALGDFLINLMDENNDPRLATYGRLSNSNYLLYERNSESLYWGRFNSPMPLITYSELLFIEAEANLMLGNISQANAKYLDAIEANMQKILVEPLKIESYLSNIDNLDPLNSLEENLELLIEQKYISLFAHGTLEAWVDYRRTGYPQLSVPADASESFNPGRVIPRRYIYPISERNTNTDNLQSAIIRQGGHLMDVDLWAFAP